MRRFTFLLFTSIIALLSLLSCIDEIDNLGTTPHDVSYALPIVNSSIAMNDILENFQEDATLVVGADELLRFQYSGDVLTKDSDDVFASINETINNFSFIPLLRSRQPLPFELPDGLSINRIRNKGTKLSYALPNRQSVAVTVTLSLPTVTLEGVPFSVSTELPAWDGDGTPPVFSNINEPVDLTGYDLTVENDSLYFELTTTDAAGNTYEPSRGSGLQLEDFAFSYAEGYLGNVEHEGDRDTIEIDLFDNWIQGDIYFEDPIITFNFENSFGVPTEAIINVFNIITAEGELLPLESTFIDNGGIQFPYPAIDEPGAVKSTTFEFNRNNSNIDVVLGSKPVAIDYDVDALTNPNNDTSITGFITDSSYYKVQVNVDLPMHGRAANFGTTDTFELNIDSYDELDQIEWKLLTTNGLPLSVELQGIFIDEAGNAVDSLFAEQAVVAAGATVNESGDPVDANELTTLVNWDRLRINNILSAKQLILRTNFSTTHGLDRSVKIRSNQALDVKLGAIITQSNQ